MKHKLLKAVFTFIFFQKICFGLAKEVAPTLPVNKLKLKPQSTLLLINEENNPLLTNIAVTTPAQQNKINISGTVKDAKTGEPIIGASVYAEPSKAGTITSRNGTFTLTVPAGKIKLTLTYVGYQKETRELTQTEDLTLHFQLQKASAQLSEVEIKGGRAANHNVASVQAGITNLNIITIKKIPAFMGEVDIIKGLKLLPGIGSVGEAATGFNVRGGSVDQNLVLLDDAPIFNTSHLFGFFSIFNPNAIRDLTLYRGGIPAQFGGRISSVLDVKQKEGDFQKFAVNGGIGLISGRLAIEGPIVKDKTSFIVAGRSSYSNWLLRKMPDVTLRNSQASFYDLSAKISHRFNDRNKLTLSAYRSRDSFGFSSDTLYNWQSTTASLKYTHTFTSKLVLDVTGVYSLYDFNVLNQEINNASAYNNGIVFKNIKADFSYATGKHQVNFGATGIDYKINPGKLNPNSEFSQVIPLHLQRENATENALYFNEEYEVSPRLTLMLGLRYAVFANYGTGEVYQYQPEVPKRERTITDTLYYNKGQIIKTYTALEPRFSLKFSLAENSSIKLGYNRSQQFIHLVSNTVAVSPTDFWKSSNTHLKPQIGDQVSLGFFRNFNQNTFELSLEGYYKKIQNMLDYKNGANLFLNKTIEADLLPGLGKAYGLETSLNKNTGRLTGWLSYTYARTLISVKGATPEETINNGAYYPATYDKPHTLNMVSNYELNKRFNLGANFTYSTGRPITAPLSHYVIGGYVVPAFGERNQFRIPDYHRLDISLTFLPNPDKKRKWESSWNFSVYNVYGRKNPYSVFFKQEYGSPPRAYQLAVVGVPLPSLTYDFKF
ncbi:TonB-dependent receptor [Adhaeribacter rhizoryzae]|uniref:TonB-dependent receptor n=1 Tax=Adhaeribacter rhizoryzae TaxID=2607907 RepID=A0A5M6DQQ0_9BACT|nr:TonB-dependent receptor [Adhaeribacter rhizoryzae]KAA5548569.1 TonB-dependent receptor [Adhaeribacter rhizoryzae]